MTFRCNVIDINVSVFVGRMSEVMALPEISEWR